MRGLFVRIKIHWPQQARMLWRRYRLRCVLWLIWTALVGLIGYWQWHADHVAHHLLNERAMVIHMLVGGLIGLIVMTKIEMRFESWRFID